MVAWWRTVRVGGGMQGVSATHLNAPSAMSYEDWAKWIASLLHVEVTNGQYTYAGNTYKIDKITRR